MPEFYYVLTGSIRNGLSSIREDAILMYQLIKYSNRNFTCGTFKSIKTVCLLCIKCDLINIYTYLCGCRPLKKQSLIVLNKSGVVRLQCERKTEFLDLIYAYVCTYMLKI